jgi:hypothetical protein
VSTSIRTLSAVLGATGLLVLGVAVSTQADDAVAPAASAPDAAAAAKNPEATTFVAGETNQVLEGQAFWAMNVKPGLYEVTFRAIMFAEVPDGAPGTNLICGVLDANTFTGQGAPRIYAVQSAAFFGELPAAMSGASTVRVKDQAQPALTCVNPAGEFQLLKPINVTFTKVDSRQMKQAEQVVDQPEVMRELRRALGG